MARTRPPYAPEFRHQMVELVRSGRSAEELAREFEPAAQAIRNWVAQSDRDCGRRGDGRTNAEPEGVRQQVRVVVPTGRAAALHGTRLAQGRRDLRCRTRRDRASVDGDLWLDQPETSRALHQGRGPKTACRRRDGHGRPGPYSQRRCPTRYGGGVRWDNSRQKVVINQRQNLRVEAWTGIEPV